MKIKRFKRPPGQEQIAQRNIVLYLREKYKCITWKTTSTGMFDPQRKIFRKPHSPIYIDGISDVIGCTPSGNILACEVKRPDKKKEATEHQKNFLISILLSGGIAFVAQNLEDVDEAFVLFKSGRVDDMIAKIEQIKTTKRY